MMMSQLLLLTVQVTELQASIVTSVPSCCFGLLAKVENNLVSKSLKPRL